MAAKKGNEGNGVDPKLAAEAKESMKALGIGDGDFKGIKFKTSGYGTPYGTIAEKDGLLFAVAPKVVGPNPIAALFVRVRAEQQQDWANVVQAPDVFGFPELTQKSKTHMSTDVYVAVGTRPITGKHVHEIIAERKLVESVVNTIADRLEKAGAKLLVPRSVIVEFIREKYADQIPDEEEKMLEEFPVVIGDKAISKRLTDIFEKYYEKEVNAAKAAGENQKPETDGGEGKEAA